LILKVAVSLVAVPLVQNRISQVTQVYLEITDMIQTKVHQMVEEVIWRWMIIDDPHQSPSDGGGVTWRWMITDIGDNFKAIKYLRMSIISSLLRRQREGNPKWNFGLHVFGDDFSARPRGKKKK
jgi:hypothetical protein